MLSQRDEERGASNDALRNSRSSGTLGRASTESCATRGSDRGIEVIIDDRVVQSLNDEE